MNSSRARRRSAALIGLALLLPTSLLRAEVKQAAADTFLIEHAQTLNATPVQVFRAIGQIEQWWSPAHTWSGSADNLSLQLRAGGCFCERWEAGEAEHLRVAHVQTNKMLRMLGGLGPLQGMAVYGSLELQLEPVEAGTRLRLSYRVSGHSQSGLDDFAAVVDGVLGAQFERLGRLISSGSAAPEPEH